MALDLKEERGVALEQQSFDWKELVPMPYSKLDADAFTRVRVILLNGIESDSVRFQHIAARRNEALRLPLARVRRVEHHQQTLVNWLNPADQSPLETTIGYEQVAIEVTASIAEHEPDPYLAQVYRYGLLEDFDHLYRYSALLDRLAGKDANNLLQSYTDVIPGRPTAVEHRAPEDDLRRHYDRRKADPLSKIHAITITAGEYQTHDYYMHVGPIFADPIARGLYAEIASIEEQHVTQYGSLIDPDETWLEQWMLHEATEAWNYWCCLQGEQDPRLKSIWERFLDYELGHLAFVRELFEKTERRDPFEVLPKSFPTPIDYRSHRDMVRRVLEKEVGLRTIGPDFVDESEVPATNPSKTYRERMNRRGVPSEIVAAGWRWEPGTEAMEKIRAGIAAGRTLQ